MKIGYYDQLGRDLDLTQRVRDAVAGEKGVPSIADGVLMRRFWFDDDTQMAPIGTLSGGERRRLQLLLTLIEQPNVLLLDEPTNDLDLDTLRALEEFLDDWPGIVVVVSHDRVFLDRTVTEVLAIDERGRVAEIAGGVAGWLAATGRRVIVELDRGTGEPPTRRGASRVEEDSEHPAPTARSGRSRAHCGHRGTRPRADAAQHGRRRPCAAGTARHRARRAASAGGCHGGTLAHPRGSGRVARHGSLNPRPPALSPGRTASRQRMFVVPGPDERQAASGPAVTHLVGAGGDRLGEPRPLVEHRPGRVVVADGRVPEHLAVRRTCTENSKNPQH